jgi:hypothetical protein
MYFERWIWAITGSDTMQSTSPVFRFHIDDVSNKNFKIDIACNSLTEMINSMCRDDFEIGMICNNSRLPLIAGYHNHPVKITLSVESM